VLAPLAVSVAEEPGQIEAALGETVTVGKALIVTFALPVIVAVHPVLLTVANTV
jgi:hypothetical protein